MSIMTNALLWMLDTGGLQNLVDKSYVFQTAVIGKGYTSLNTKLFLRDLLA